MTPTVSIVVLNWNGRRHLADSLGSLSRLDYPERELEIILCDNGSRDGSVELVRQTYPRVRVVELDRNHGFAEGNDLGARGAKGEWLGFLNNDMWVEPDWLRRLVAPLAEHPEIDSLASKILNWDGSAIDFVGGGVSLQGFGFSHDHGRKASPRDVAGPVLFACGGAMLIRRELFEEVGGFDPDYFAFYEDVDLGWRLNVLGRTVWYNPDAVAYHRHHGTADRVPGRQMRVLYERNSLYTMFKCLDEANLAAALPATMLLLNEKALRMADLDRTPFRLGPPGAADAPHGKPQALHAFDPAAGGGSVLAKARTVFREHGARVLARRGARYLGSRAGGRLRRVRSRVAGADSRLPDVSVSHYVALSDFAHNLDRMLEKRAWLQARRKRSDEELMPLFHYALEPSYSDSRYVQFHRRLLEVLGLDRRFAAGHDHVGS